MKTTTEQIIERMDAAGVLSAVEDCRRFTECVKGFAELAYGAVAAKGKSDHPSYGDHLEIVEPCTDDGDTILRNRATGEYWEVRVSAWQLKGNGEIK